MKSLILHLKENWQVFVFAVIGLLLVLFPAHVAGAAPYIIGVCSLLYAAVNIIISLKYPDARTKLGDSIAQAVIGAVILFLKGDSISVIGVIWAVLSLNEVAAEIDEYHKTKHISLVSGISILVSMILAALLMMDPFAHFTMHIKILGLEMISSAFIRRRKGVPEED